MIHPGLVSHAMLMLGSALTSSSLMTVRTWQGLLSPELWSSLQIKIYVCFSGGRGLLRHETHMFLADGGKDWIAVQRLIWAEFDIEEF